MHHATAGQTALELNRRLHQLCPGQGLLDPALSHQGPSLLALSRQCVSRGPATASLLLSLSQPRGLEGAGSIVVATRHCTCRCCCAVFHRLACTPRKRMGRLAPAEHPGSGCVSGLDDCLHGVQQRQSLTSAAAGTCADGGGVPARLFLFYCQTASAGPLH